MIDMYNYLTGLALRKSRHIQMFVEPWTWTYDWYRGFDCHRRNDSCAFLGTGLKLVRLTNLLAQSRKFGLYHIAPEPRIDDAMETIPT